MKVASGKKINIIPLIARGILAISMLISLILIIISIFTDNMILVYAGSVLLLFSCAAEYQYITINSTKDGLTSIDNADGIMLHIVFLKLSNKLSKYNSAFLNICDLSYVNNLSGSVGGDLLLRNYAQTINSFLNKDERIGRLGGDNFIILIRKEHTASFLEKINPLSVTIELPEGKKTFSVKTRVGLYDIKPENPVGHIISCSNTAMTYLKTKNEGLVCWYAPHMSNSAYREKEVSFLFSDAIKNREFEVYFQPMVDSSTNTLIGCEALARWIRNDEIVPPSDFIPTLEKSGLITELDFYVFEQVCRNLIRWKSDNKRLVPVSTNFSKIHLKNPDFATRILAIIAKYNVDKSMIQIELTESAGIEDFASLKAFLKVMHDAEIQVAIDDFGVGYSSLELLKDRNFSIIKIDKTFIDNITDNGGENINLQLVRSILNTCRELNKRIVCEGVETQKQKELLSQLDCNQIQGYLYDEPLPVFEFEKRLATFKYYI